MFLGLVQLVIAWDFDFYTRGSGFQGWSVHAVHSVLVTEKAGAVQLLSL